MQGYFNRYVFSHALSFIENIFIFIQISTEVYPQWFPCTNVCAKFKNNPTSALWFILLTAFI